MSNSNLQQWAESHEMDIAIARAVIEHAEGNQEKSNHLAANANDAELYQIIERAFEIAANATELNWGNTIWKRLPCDMGYSSSSR